jgi:murein DD-endopeptidase MepM/ murein hydrolase activator NlpD
MLILVGIAVFSVFTLNWRNADSAPIVPGLDPGVQVNMASYAGIAPLSASGFDAEDAIPLDLVESFHWESHTVRSGETVSKIAADHSVSMDAIIASNGITNARRLREGMVIRIPNMDGIPYTVKGGDSLSGISASMGVPLEAILDANEIESDAISAGMTLFIPGAKMRSEDLRQALGEIFIYPIRGRLTSPFGWRNDPISGARRYHSAIDLAAPTGTPIKAAMDGRISTVGLSSVYGKYIIISHSGGLQTWYAHMSATSATQGAYVRQGAKIGEVGSTGYSTGPHLHFAVFKNGKAVNPLELLTK